MPMWIVILISAGGAGLLLLNGFSKTKETSEIMLEKYEDMLQEAARKKLEQEAEEQSNPEDEVASADDPDETEN